MFSLSGPSAKKVIRGESSFALVNYSIAVYWFFEVWLPAGISLKLVSWLQILKLRGIVVVVHQFPKLKRILFQEKSIFYFPLLWAFEGASAVKSPASVLMNN